MNFAPPNHFCRAPPSARLLQIANKLGANINDPMNEPTSFQNLYSGLHPQTQQIRQVLERPNHITAPQAVRKPSPQPILPPPPPKKMVVKTEKRESVELDSEFLSSKKVFPSKMDIEESKRSSTPAKTTPNSQWVHTPGHKGNPGVDISSKFSDVLQKHFFLYVVGKPGSGKTFIIEELVLNPDFYMKRFDKVLIVSPYDLPTLPCVEGKNYWSTFDPEALMQALSIIAKSKPTSNVLIIIDDFIAMLGKKGTREAFMHLVYNRRKLIPNGTISFLVTGQKYIILPPAWRSVLTGLIVFPVQGNDWNTIARENIFIDNTRLIKELILRHWKQDKHNFVYINLEKGETYLNFSEKL